MDITITDPELLARFAAATDAVNIKGPDGHILVRLVMKKPDKRHHRPEPTITEEQIDELMQEYPKGRSLKDIIADLQKRDPS